MVYGFSFLNPQRLLSTALNAQAELQHAAVLLSAREAINEK